ncbi:MAG: hypothetical protein ACREDO_01675 [Methyloceanibacter sp.]
MTEDEITTAELARLFATTPKTIADLSKRGLIVKASGRGRWKLRESVSGYCRHLREQAAGRGGEDAAAARARLRQAQVILAETKAAKMRGELVEAAAVEKLWITKMKAFRGRLLGIPQRVQYLSARQIVVLQQELRAALTELANDDA